jgi:hypothetical protein
MFHWDVSGAELLAGKRLEKRLGGADLFLALELISEQPAPREVSGTLQLAPENGPHGCRPIYFLGRQVDDAKAYTSPLYMTFV